MWKLPKPTKQNTGSAGKKAHNLEMNIILKISED